MTPLINLNDIKFEILAWRSNKKREANFKKMFKVIVETVYTKLNHSLDGCLKQNLLL